MARCDYKLVIHYGYQHEGTLAADYRATLLSGMQRLTEEEAAGQVRSAAACVRYILEVVEGPSVVDVSPPDTR